MSTDVVDVPDRHSPPQVGSNARDGVCGDEHSLPYPFHPLADVFPLMEGKEFDLFKEDVQRNGLLHPIVLYEGAVWDGRNRLKACIETGVPVRTDEFVGSDPVSSLISANLSRRHMTTRERAVAAARLSNLPVGRPGENTPNGGISQADAAKLFNVSLRSVQRAATRSHSANVEPIEKVENGTMSVSLAARVVKQPAEAQSENTINPPGFAEKARAGREGARPSQSAKQTEDRSLDVEMPGVGLGSDPLPDTVKDKTENRNQARENAKKIAHLMTVYIPNDLLSQVIGFRGHCRFSDVIAFIRQRQLL